MKIFEGKLSQTLMATLLLTLTAQAGNLAVDCRPGGKGAHNHWRGDCPDCRRICQESAPAHNHHSYRDMR